MAMPGRINLFNAKSTCFMLIAIWCYVFWPTIRIAMNSYLHSGYDYQGFLVLPIIFLSLLRNSSNLKRAKLTYNTFGLFILLLCATGWLFATIIELEILRQAAIISMLIAIVLTTCGKKITAILALPFACLFLLLPVGQNITNFALQTFSWVLVQALTISKQSVYWEGNQIFANNHTYDIYAYLRSLQYIQLFIAVGAGYAMLRTKNIMAFLITTLSFVVMPFTILWLSMFCYVLVSHWAASITIIDNNLTIIGWALSIIGLLHAVVLGIFIGDRRNVISATDDIDWHNDYFARRRKFAPPLIIAGSILLLMPIIAQQIKSNVYQPEKSSLLAMPSTSKKHQQLVSLSISHTTQPHSSSWKKIKETTKKIKLTQHNLPIHETVLHNKNKYKIIWSVNYVNGHFTTNPTIAKALTNLYHLTGRLSGQNAKTGIITMTTDASNELSTARDRLKDFLQDFADNHA